MEPLKILFVDDDRDICITGKKLLERKGFTVQCAASGEEALEKLRTFTPDLILLDVMMPKMDGISTFQEIKKRFASRPIPVVFLTARVLEKEIEEYKKMGITSVIAKPFDPTKLANDVYQLWHQQKLAG